MKLCKVRLDYNQEVFKQLFYYDETSSSGLRYISENNCAGVNKRYKDDVAGTIRNSKVWVVKVKNKAYLIHRIIWFLKYGEVSDSKIIDHIDGNPLNNKLSNLRLTTQIVNNRNHSMQKNNSSGKTGVHLDGKYWRVQWYENGKRKSKRFISIEDASKHRDMIISQIGNYTERHGN